MFELLSFVFTVRIAKERNLDKGEGTGKGYKPLTFFNNFAI